MPRFIVTCLDYDWGGDSWVHKAKSHKKALRSRLSNISFPQDALGLLGKDFIVTSVEPEILNQVEARRYHASWDSVEQKSYIDRDPMFNR